MSDVLMCRDHLRRLLEQDQGRPKLLRSVGGITTGGFAFERAGRHGSRWRTLSCQPKSNRISPLSCAASALTRMSMRLCRCPEVLLDARRDGNLRRARHRNSPRLPAFPDRVSIQQLTSERWHLAARIVSDR